MDTKEAYKKRIDAELDVVQAKFAKFKAERMAITADARKKHAEHVDELEKKFAGAHAKLRELGEADEQVWEQLKDGFEDTWTTLQSTLENTVATFQKKRT